MMKIANVMTDNVKSCTADMNLAAVTQLLWEHDCGVIPVVNERSEVIGILTDRDICIALGTRNQAASTLTAGDVMSRDVLTCAPEDDCADVLQMMARRRIRRTPVAAIGGVLKGIVSLNDLVVGAASAHAGSPTRDQIVDTLSQLCAHVHDHPRQMLAV
jgi:CBS-domain-containing membrane protein